MGWLSVFVPVEARVIPEMTDRLSQYWEQPNRNDIVLDETHAGMEQATFEKLAEYSITQPSGVYDGKMWKSQRPDGVWRLCWYGPSVDPDYCKTFSRIIVIV